MKKHYSPSEWVEIMRRYKYLIQVWSRHKNIQNEWIIRRAFHIALNAHKEARRRSGEPYIYHPIEVATIVARDIGLGSTSIVSALLHDLVEDTDFTLQEVEKVFGKKVARIIDGLTKIDTIDFDEKDQKSLQAENLKKVFSSIEYDVRVILIKLADRLHNMRTLEHMPYEKQLKIASETANLYAPIANRLGLYAIKSELEDLSFKYTQPNLYKNIYKSLENIRIAKIQMIETFLAPIKERIQYQEVKWRVMIKERTPFQIWKRMEKRNVSFEEMTDSHLVQFIIDSELENEKIDCWRVYSIISDIYPLQKNSIKDWISLPKINGYRAIHAKFMGKEGEWIGVQIRSERMEAIAEKGYIAYQENRDDAQGGDGPDVWLNEIRNIISEKNMSTFDFIENIKLSFFSDEIVVYTPKGKMFFLPQGSTALDFAYYIHTELGNQCIGAKINHRLAQIDQVLRSGDQVEIIRSVDQVPKEEWFDFVVTARAKSRIKSAIRDYRKTFSNEGRSKLINYFKHLNLEFSDANKNKIIEAENLGSKTNLYYFVAIGRITLATLKTIFKKENGYSFVKFISFGFWNPSKKETQERSQPQNKESVDYTVATCCNPIPGDDVIGIAFENEPVRIHRVDCVEAQDKMTKFGNNIVKVKWRSSDNISFLAGLKIVAVDSLEFPNKLTVVITKEQKRNIRSISFFSSQGKVEVVVAVYVANETELRALMNELKKIKEVEKVLRVQRIDNSLK